MSSTMSGITDNSSSENPENIIKIFINDHNTHDLNLDGAISVLCNICSSYADTNVAVCIRAIAAAFF